MTEEHFTTQAEAFLSHLTGSRLYQDVITLSEEMKDDDRLRELAARRDRAYQLSQEAGSEDEKRRYQIEAKKANDTLLQDDHVSRYLSAYRDIKDVLSLLNTAIFEELNHD